jgi:hypothetical protein
MVRALPVVGAALLAATHAHAQDARALRIESTGGEVVEVLRGQRWTPVCRTPCSVDAASPFRLAGDSAWFLAPNDAAIAHLTPSGGRAAVGAPLIGVGTLLTFLGAAGLVFDHGGSGNASSGLSGSDPEATLFWAPFVLGLATVSVGIVLVATDHTTASFDSRTTRLELTSSIALTPRGLEF